MNDLMFVLITNEDGYKTLDVSPDGWDESMITWERSEKYWGVFRSWTIPLKFVKDGATYLRREFYTNGMLGYAQIYIKKYDKVNQLWFTSFVGYMDFATFKDSDYYVECSFSDSGAAKLLKDYGGNEYQIGNGKVDSYGFTEDVIFKHSGSQFYGSKILHLGISLLNIMSAGEVIAANPKYSLRSDYLTNLTYSDVYGTPANHQVIMVPGAQFRDKNQKIGYFRTSFDDWFKSVSALFNLGLGIEYDATGKEVIRIEPKAYFFATGDPLDFGQVKNIQISTAAKLLFKRLKIGYEPKTYSNDTALYRNNEVNATAKWEIKNDISGNEMDLVSKYRADGAGIVDIINTGTDSSDEDIFFVQLEYVAPDWIIDTVGKAQVTNEATAAYDLINSLITPRRNLMRWVDYLSSCMFGMAGEDLAFTSGDNEIQFRKTSLSDGGTGFVNEDLSWEITNPDWFFPVIFEVETAAPADLISQIMAKPTGLYQFTFNGVNYLGHIMKIDAKISGRSAQKMTFLANASTSFYNLIDRTNNGYI